MEQTRTFIAIELPPETRAALEAFQAQLKMQMPPRSVRWTKIANLHLTLHFLGEMPQEAISKIEQALQQATNQATPFQLQIAGLGCFPNLRRPRVVWAGVQGEIEALQQLHTNLGQALNQAINFTPETRPYSPHLTMGRAEKRLPAAKARQLSQALERAQNTLNLAQTLPVSGISLMKSELRPTGPIYTSLSHADFSR